MTEASLGLENIDKWLGDRKWDVIHFNWGLWDICYRHPDSKQQGQAYKLPAGSFFTVTGGKISRITTYYNLSDWIAQVSA